MISVVKYPERAKWETLTQRPVVDSKHLDTTVRDILKDVQSRGDQALTHYAQKFDGLKLQELTVSRSDIKAARVAEDLQQAIKLAYLTIEKFHRNQVLTEPAIETMPGIKCWRESVPIEKVGLYIPGGTAPLFSTILMLGIPAKIAGCKEIILCTPAGKNGKIHPAILFTAGLLGIGEIYKVGGAQAIAAMAFGTVTIPKVFKIFGPGNQYVTRAKELVQQQGVAIDMPAGPSEVLVIADESCNPAFVAADLLAQVEHGKDSQAVLVSNSRKVVNEVSKQLSSQLDNLPRKKMAGEALDKSLAVLLNTLDECMAFSNVYAPEHLIICTKDNQSLARKVINAGSVFLGTYSCESVGDYATGTNHTLPTQGYARSYSGVSVESFVKKISFQELTMEGLKNIGPAVEKMAEAENLLGHKNAVTLRLKELENV